MSYKRAIMIVCLVAVCCNAQELAFRAKVFDSETREAVSNVEIVASFRDVNFAKGDGWKFTEKVQKTDEGGVACFSGRSSSGFAECVFKGNGEYYKSLPVAVEGGKGADADAGASRFFVPKRWVVTNDVMIALKRVVNPIPLRMKCCNIKLKDDMSAACKGVLSYDLMCGDWLPPFGNGQVADVEFRRLPHEDLGEVLNVNGKPRRMGRDSVSIRFLGADNGLVQCQSDPSATLRIREAPVDGYVPEHLIWFMIDKNLRGRKSDDYNAAFAFRVRTKRNERGEIVEAYYGKIYGNPQLNNVGSVIKGVWFMYYLNPESLDRNLEWDMKTNLLPGVKPMAYWGKLMP